MSMPPCPDSAESPTHKHAVHTRPTPFPEVGRRQDQAFENGQILVFNAIGEIKFITLANWPRMTKDLKKSIFVGSTLPDKAILPPRLWEAYFNLKNTWVFCSCVTTMGRGQPVEGCRVRIVQARPDKGNLWHLTCHLRDQRNLKRMTCNYFAHAELVFKELGGKDPDNPDFVPKGAEKPAPKVEEAPAVAADVSASDFSDQEIIPPSVPVTPSASPTKASRRPSGYPFEDLHGPRRTPASASSSQGSIVPSSVQSNVSSPFVIVQRQQREPSITILSSDESDGDVARNTTVRTARPRPLPSTAHRNANPAASVEDTPTPKPRRTQDKGKGRAAAPVVKEEDHEADNIRESDLISGVNALQVFQGPGQPPFAIATNGFGQVVSVVPMTAPPQISVDPRALPRLSTSTFPRDIHVDRSNQIYYNPTPGNVSPKKRQHADSVSSTASGGPSGPQRARVGSISTSNGPTAFTPAASDDLVQSNGSYHGSYFIGNATHSAACDGQFPYGLTTPTRSSQDPFVPGFTPGRFFPGPHSATTLPTESPSVETGSQQDEKTEKALNFYLHITAHFPEFVDFWNETHKAGGRMHVDHFLEKCGLRLCHSCLDLTPAGELGGHHTFECEVFKLQAANPRRDPGISRRDPGIPRSHHP